MSRMALSFSLTIGIVLTMVPSPGRAEDRDNVALEGVEIDAAQHFERAEGLAQAANAEDGWLAHARAVAPSTGMG